MTSLEKLESTPNFFYPRDLANYSMFDVILL